ncbi:TPA: LysR family transcriptional regulator [Salmonella enterica subsp. enterica serovar Saintpaul str. CFSAN004155]|uniref:LysR family transcriptional regulator n=1 Tax=Citrobacter portucalensis TaxID=1639133 RepID=UPI002B13F678|nr:LysR family transcriptional regulator [Salmonella enterica subsp. enterica]HCZ4653358.1 LysR family transcriptional regulator [Salmonella enterica subsp. enterica serovar Saintpaul str. CFSAN004157]HCZ4664602.1 LysR family transcriptional regulator [Salmonella enterica subsp. enterica serovar Saintpaul str. CFSAN004155]HCZ4690861.1 LysR family transcriptional regulator [Salmonella enterica subsp. enterica serovar Saintpaul str. CFSAN004153]HCZ4695326.1 LysR family transcriptional regulator [
MPNDNFRRIIKYDVNLLVSLYFLLKECQVSAAANKIFIGQPAMSHHLAKLRDIFNDKLLIRTSTKMILTPFAENILPILEKLLVDMENIMKKRGGEYLLQKEKYKVCVTDDIYIKNATIMLYRYAKELGVEDIVEFEVTSRYPDCVKDLNAGVIDLFFGNIDKLSGNILSQPFSEDCWCWAVGAKNPLAGKHITPCEINRAIYVDIIFLEKAKHVIYQQFGEVMNTMKCVLKTSSFSAAINFIQNSEALCMLPEHLINKYNLSVVMLGGECDTKVASHVYWHRSVDSDIFHQRLRNVLLKKHIELI